MGMHNPDLFEFADSYPNRAGHRDTDTSRAAAEAMQPRLGNIQKAVLEALRDRPMTSFELAAATGYSYAAVQPRTAELSRRTMNRPALVRDSGERRENPETGRQGIVWERCG